MSGATHAEVIVAGAGISGLTLAWRLQQQGSDVLVLEQSRHAGGAIRSTREQGLLVEDGPNSALETTPLLTELIRELGLEGGKCYANRAAAKRYILRGGRLVALPMSPISFLGTPLFSWGSKLRLFREPFIAPADPACDETVADFVVRRLGREFLDYAINPFVAGVYAGDPARLSVRAAFPRLFEVEQRYGSLIKAQLRGRRERKRNPEKSKQSAELFSFREGMGTLTRALAERLRRVELATRLEAVTHGVASEHGGDGYTLLAATDAGPRSYTCTALVLATPAGPAADLLGELAPSLAPVLREIPYPPVAAVVSAYARAPGMHPLDGFGFLVPAAERRDILGTIFSSTLFPGRAPEGEVLLTSFVGGMRQPELAQQSEEQIAALVVRELAELLKTPTRARFVRVKRWERAIPQYTPGHLQRVAALEQTERELPGLFFCANYRGGISVGDCVKSAHARAEAVVGHLEQVRAKNRGR